MERTELAWAAGFWDGEGSAYLSGADERVTKQPQARINQAGEHGIPEVLLRFQRAVGVGRIQGPDLEEGRLPLYRWVASSRPDISATYHAIAPWVGDVKRTQLEEVLGMKARRRVPFEDLHALDQLAWCAGLFDGEGSTYLLKHRSHPGYVVLETAVTQASWIGTPEVLERFRSHLGIGRLYGPYGAGAGWAPVYRWKAHRRSEIEALMAKLSRYLGTIKIAQAQAAIAVVAAQPTLRRGNPSWGNRKTHCVNGHEYATARVRPFRPRSAGGVERRPSKQCLACVREYAREKRGTTKSGGPVRRSS